MGFVEEYVVSFIVYVIIVYVLVFYNIYIYIYFVYIIFKFIQVYSQFCILRFFDLGRIY